MIREAIANYINALAEKNRPCKHDWERLSIRESFNKSNPDFIWTDLTYRCRKCCKAKHISTKQAN